MCLRKMFSSGSSSGEAIPVLLATSSKTMLMSPTSSSWIENRVPPVLTQWVPEETRDLIMIRGEMEKEVAQGNNNNNNNNNNKNKKKTVWEAVSSRMRERGHYRNPEQCKCKWKNLLLRYKEKETADPECGQPCPFFEELHSVFSEREEMMHRLLLESEAGSTKSRKRDKQMVGDRLSADFSEGDYEIEHRCEEEEEEEEEKVCGNNSRKRKGETSTMVKYSSKRKATDGSDNSGVGGIHELLKKFLQQQQKMEIEWMKMMERRTSQHELFEQEWRQSMEKLERERLMIDQAWREREEQRRIRAENRAERRDALLNTLLNQLLSEDNV